MINYICSANGNITIMLNGEVKCVASDHANYRNVVQALKKNDEDALGKALDIQKAVTKYIGSTDVEVRDGCVFYRGEQVRGYIVDRILQQMRAGFGYEPMCAFLENLYDNPSPESVEQLFKFLEDHGLVLTDDGCFLAYKYVDKRADGKFYANWSNKDGTHNESGPGSVVRMPRSEVEHNPAKSCAPGLHVGSMEYVQSSEWVMTCKVNPKHVVSVPNHESGKMRTCQYEVIEVNQNKEAKQGLIYSNDLGRSDYAPEGDYSTNDHWDYDEDGYDEGYWDEDIDY